MPALTSRRPRGPPLRATRPRGPASGPSPSPADRAEPGEEPGAEDPLGRLAGELGEEAEGGDEPWAEAVARRAERHRADGRPFVVLAIEVDDVERLLAADRGGDAARAVARVEAALREELRTADVVLRERPGRLWVVAVDVATAGARALGERLAAAAGSAALHETPLTVSIGFAACPADGTDAAALVAHAEEGVFAARAAGVRLAYGHGDAADLRLGRGRGQGRRHRRAAVGQDADGGGRGHPQRLGRRLREVEAGAGGERPAVDDGHGRAAAAVEDRDGRPARQRAVRDAEQQAVEEDAAGGAPAEEPRAVPRARAPGGTPSSWPGRPPPWRGRAPGRDGAPRAAGRRARPRTGRQRAATVPSAPAVPLAAGTHPRRASRRWTSTARPAGPGRTVPYSTVTRRRRTPGGASSVGVVVAALVGEGDGGRAGASAAIARAMAQAARQVRAVRVVVTGRGLAPAGGAAGAPRTGTPRCGVPGGLEQPAWWSPWGPDRSRRGTASGRDPTPIRPRGGRVRQGRGSRPRADRRPCSPAVAPTCASSPTACRAVVTRSPPRRSPDRRPSAWRSRRTGPCARRPRRLGGRPTRWPRPGARPGAGARGRPWPRAPVAAARRVAAGFLAAAPPRALAAPPPELAAARCADPRAAVRFAVSLGGAPGADPALRAAAFWRAAGFALRAAGFAWRAAGLRVAAPPAPRAAAGASARVGAPGADAAASSSAACGAVLARFALRRVGRVVGSAVSTSCRPGRPPSFAAMVRFCPIGAPDRGPAHASSSRTGPIR